jgi:GNAT superfamily N-acetyltransferase
MAGMSVRIRLATVADAETIVRHRERMFADMGDGSEQTRAAMVAAARPFIRAGLADGSYRAWLAELDGRVVAGGGVAIVGFQPTPLDPGPRRAWVLNVYTEPAFRRQGLARQIVEHIIAWCREQGFAAVMLHASDDGRPLYEELGFQPTNEMRLLLK